MAARNGTLRYQTSEVQESSRYLSDAPGPGSAFDEYNSTMDNYMRYGWGSYNLDGSPVTLSEYFENQHKTDFFEENYHHYYSKYEVEEARKRQNELLNLLNSIATYGGDALSIYQFAKGIGNTYGKSNLALTGASLLFEGIAALNGDENAQLNIVPDALFSVSMIALWSTAPYLCFTLTVLYQIHEANLNSDVESSIDPLQSRIRQLTVEKPTLPSIKNLNLPQDNTSVYRPNIDNTPFPRFHNRHMNSYQQDGGMYWYFSPTKK